VLVERGHIYLGTYEGWYSVRDECFYTEGELVGGKAPTGADVSWVAKEPSYFFRLSRFEQPLLDYYESHPDFIAPESRRNEVVSFVRGGLRDLSVSRTGFSWGVPVPGDGRHVMYVPLGEKRLVLAPYLFTHTLVFQNAPVVSERPQSSRFFFPSDRYVWVDALANYISALGYPVGEGGDGGGLLTAFWPASLHVVGKDILRFHAVYWPALLMAAGLDVPRRLFAHGWWTKDGQKISKSVGNVIDPVELVEKVGTQKKKTLADSSPPPAKNGQRNAQRRSW
jgi:methionyl-tRNA synthetase